MRVEASGADEDGQGGLSNTNHRHRHTEHPGRAEAPPLEERSNEELVLLYREANCVDCLDVLLRKNEGLLHHAVKRFSYSSEPYEDLFQVARMGLLKAAQRFDATRSESFATYAFALVDGEVRHHLRDNLMIRIPRWAKTIYGRILQTQQDYYQREGRPPTVPEIAKETNIREEGILEILRVFGAANLHSLDEPFGEESKNLHPNRDVLKAIRQESFVLPIEDRITLYESVTALSDLHKRLIYLLFFRDFTQQEAGDELGMSQRKISRERTQALSRLRAILGKKIL